MTFTSTYHLVSSRSQNFRVFSLISYQFYESVKEPNRNRRSVNQGDSLVIQIVTEKNKSPISEVNFDHLQEKIRNGLASEQVTENL